MNFAHPALYSSGKKVRYPELWIYLLDQTDLSTFSVILTFSILSDLISASYTVSEQLDSMLLVVGGLLMQRTIFPQVYVDPGSLCARTEAAAY